MKRKLKYSKSEGLPGGPNEMFTYITGVFSESPVYHIPGITKGKSSIEGDGMFTTQSFKKGALIGLAHENNQPATELGRMHNHDEINPTMISKKIGNQRYVYASRDLKPGEELTTNYRMQPELEQPEQFQNGGEFDPEMMFKDRYNTKLTPAEKKKFDKWVAEESTRQGRDILMDMGAYDVQGFWKSGDYKMKDSDGHGADTWKKPNHPTFSNQSKYHGADGWYGGNWTKDAGYQPSKQTLQVYGPEYYDRMFKSEPNRPEYLDMSRYKSGINKPTPMYYQEGGETDRFIFPRPNDKYTKPKFDYTPPRLPKSKLEAEEMMASGELYHETPDEREAREKAEREALLKAYEERRNNPNYNSIKGLPGESMLDVMYNEAAPLDVMFRVSQENNFFDDYINPAVMIGSMAKSLGQAPKLAKESGSIMPYVVGLGMPLATGALASVGAKGVKQFTNNLVNPLAGMGDLSGNLANSLRGTYHFAKELSGEMVKGKANKEAIKKGNEWLKNWIEHPATKNKINSSVNEKIDNAINYANDLDPEDLDQIKDVYKTIDNYNLIKNQSKTFTPDTKEYPLSKQFYENLNSYISKYSPKHIHEGNVGVSYKHHYSPIRRDAVEKGVVIPNDRYGSWVSRSPFISESDRISTTIHEATHDWLSPQALNASGIRNTALKNMNPNIRKSLTEWETHKMLGENPFKEMGREKAFQAYLANPAEQHARIMELRKQFNINPDDLIDTKKAEFILNKIKNKKTKINPKFLNVIDNDPEKLANLFNNFWAVPGMVSAGAALQEYQKGGETDYIVEKGDTLSKIALENNTTVNKLASINNIQNPDLILIGQKLKLADNNEEYVSHIVQQGETLSEIAKKYNTTVDNIVNLNSINTPDLILPNEEIFIKNSQTQENVVEKNENPTIEDLVGVDQKLIDVNLLPKSKTPEVLSEKATNSETPEEAPIFGGTLKVANIIADSQTQYPHYDMLSEEEKKYFYDESPIGRYIRSKAKGHGVWKEAERKVQNKFQVKEGDVYKGANEYTYYGPKEFSCKGAQCSSQATTEVANLFGVERDTLNPHNAWFKRAAVLKEGGIEVWKKGDKDYSGVQVGDFVSLRDYSRSRKSGADPDLGFSASDNEGNQHLGFIVGFDKDGTPLVQHGSEYGKTYVQRITDVFLPDAGVRTFHYKPTSIYRSKAIIDKAPTNKRFYTAPEVPMYVDVKKDDYGYAMHKGEVSEDEAKFLDAINQNAFKQQRVLGLNSKEVATLGKLAYGIFHAESKAGETLKPIPLKSIGANLAYKTNLKSTPASYSNVQFKIDYVSKNQDGSKNRIGRYLEELNVDERGLKGARKHNDDYNDEVNAVVAYLTHYYKQIKNNPEKYNYNPETNTVYGNIPIEKALLASYKNPSKLLSGDRLKKDTYHVLPYRWAYALSEKPFDVEMLAEKQEGGEIDLYKRYVNGELNNDFENKQAEKVYNKLNRVYLNHAKEKGMNPTNYIMTYL